MARQKLAAFAAALVFTLLIAIGTGLPSSAEEPDPATFERSYTAEILPILKQYCHECHSGDLIESQIDLGAFESWAQVRKHPQVWQKVGSMVDSGQMPPADAAQPTDEERARLKNWVRTYVNWESRELAGDPGRVVLRRLNNAELTYTLRDLTGLPELEPAEEFPVDSAAGEGFTNTGNSLVMSPALVTKYLDAAKKVAAHVVLLPDGIRFSPHTTPRDWTDETLARIREFYGRFSDATGATRVNLQGVINDTNQGGRLPLEAYLVATLQEREALSTGQKSIETVARERQLSAKYLGILWTSLNDTRASVLLDALRAQWRAARSEDARALASGIAAWQQVLWTFGTVGHIGKVGGPKSWLQPFNLAVASQQLRLKIPHSDQPVTVSLIVTSAGDGNQGDVVVLRKPRLVAPELPEVLLRDVRRQVSSGTPFFPPASARHAGATEEFEWGLDPAAFGKRPDGSVLADEDLCIPAPAVIEFQLPSNRAKECDLVADCVLDDKLGAGGSVQLHLVLGKPDEAHQYVTEGWAAFASGRWKSASGWIDAAPILVAEDSEARKRIESAFEDFQALFPAAVCYTTIVPVDEVVTLMLFYREDDHLVRLMLDDVERARLDRLWNELHYVSQDALAQVDALEQLIQFATQDADPSVFEPLRQPYAERAAAFQQLRVDSEPHHLRGMLEFADRAFRRTLSRSERDELQAFYQAQRAEGIPHDEAIRLTLVRILASPAFLYRTEMPGPGAQPGPVSDEELATRLSYFLWSSLPDDELRALAAARRLSDPDVLVSQMRRLLREDKARRLATEFACQWLQIYNFDQLDEKSESQFPTFGPLRGAMYEESIQFFTDLFQRDASVLDILDADYTFLNADLANHYDIPGIEGDGWRRVDGVKKYSRGGVLAQATTLAKQSGASRTSPILRGNWVSEVLLGERLPRPPKGVPELPDSEKATEQLTVRQLVERHTSDAKCAVCHQRIDPLGFSLEGFDAIGRRRAQDLAGRPIDNRARTLEGVEFEGLDGLRNYLLTVRRDTFVRQFCRKLLGYALGRPVGLSDELLLAEMQTQLKANDYRFSVAVEAIVRSRQFREIRGADTADDE